MDDRTVANELQNGSTQSSLACKSCRRKKLGCDRSVPQCRNCQKTQRTCEYPAVAYKPGPRPGTHRRNGDANHRPNATKPRSIASTGSPHANGSQYTTESGHSPELQISSTSDSPCDVACKMMGLSETACMKVVRVFFENVTTFGLFHQPTFLQKVASISSAKQIQALFTSMFAVSIRFMKSDDLLPSPAPRPIDILESAYTLNNECLAECGDETPPLHVLQSFILQTFMFSTFGVRGKAWRLVGQCIRMAYELRLHEVDIDLHDKQTLPENSPQAGTESWIAKEEKRRAWWAIWECDIFSSTLQRLPKGIDWGRSRTNLPATNEAWFNNTLYPSCYFRVDVHHRWRTLRDSGNESPIAWFILLNSYKWESLSVTQRMNPPTSIFDNEDHMKSQFDSADYCPILSRKREVLENCLRCAVAAIPPSLQPNGYLAFEPARTTPYPSVTLAHDHGVYALHIMSQVTQLMLSRRDLEGGNFIPYPADFTTPTPTPTDKPIEHKSWQRCLLSADRMASIVRAAAPHHHRLVNPNMATALWMAATTQLAVLAYHRHEIDVDLARSNLDLLTTTIESFVEFWDVPATLLASLKMVDGVLRARREADLSNAGGGGDSSTRDRIGVVQQHQQQQQYADGLPGAGDGMPQGDGSLDLSPFDVIQAMDFGAMYNGVENWESLFLDPALSAADFVY